MKNIVVSKLGNMIKDMGYNGQLDKDISIQEIGISSFYMMKLIVQIEDEFSIDFDIEDIDFSNIDTIDKLINLIVEKIDSNDNESR